MVETELHNVIQRLFRVGRTVEGAMKGDGHAFGCPHQPPTRLYVYPRLLGETTEHDSVGTQFLAHAYVLIHALQFQGCVEKVAATRTDDDMQQGAVEHAPGRLDFAIRGCGSALGYASAEFHPVSTAFLCRQTTLHAVGTHFKFEFFHFSFLFFRN